MLRAAGAHSFGFPGHHPKTNAEGNIYVEKHWCFLRLLLRRESITDKTCHANLFTNHSFHLYFIWFSTQMFIFNWDLLRKVQNHVIKKWLRIVLSYAQAVSGLIQTFFSSSGLFVFFYAHSTVLCAFPPASIRRARQYPVGRHPKISPYIYHYSAVWGLRSGVIYFKFSLISVKNHLILF